MKTNNLLVLLIIFAFGALIYYMTKPKKMNENNITSILLLVGIVLVIYYFFVKNKKLGKTINKGIKKLRFTNLPQVNKVEYSNEDFSEENNQEQIQQESHETFEPFENVSSTSNKKLDPVPTLPSQTTGAPVMPIMPQELKLNTTNYDTLNIDSYADYNSAFEAKLKNDAVVDINSKNMEKYNAKDFLPKEYNKSWFDTDFSQAKYNINDDNLINTDKYIIGINTVGQSLKNPSYDIRGTIPNPKFSVSPWNNSTYEPDFNIKPLC